MKNIALGGLAATASGGSISLAGASWWAVFVVVLGLAAVFLISLHMTYQRVDRLAQLAHPPSFKGLGRGIQAGVCARAGWAMIGSNRVAMARTTTRPPGHRGARPGLSGRRRRARPRSAGRR